MEAIQLKTIKGKHFPQGRTFDFAVRLELDVENDIPTKFKDFTVTDETIAMNLQIERDFYQSSVGEKLCKRIVKFFAKENGVREMRTGDTVILFTQGRLEKGQDSGTDMTTGERDLVTYYTPTLTLLTASLFRDSAIVAEQSLI